LAFGKKKPPMAIRGGSVGTMDIQALTRSDGVGDEASSFRNSSCCQCPERKPAVPAPACASEAVAFSRFNALPDEALP
jgi:hypothetical protein